MLLTDQLSRMNLKGMRREGSFSRHLKGFTSIIECLSPDQPSLLKDSESPSHDEIRTDNIVDPVKRRKANAQLDKLAAWVRGQITEKTTRVSDSRIGEANELNKYIALDGDSDPGQGNGHRTPAIAITPAEPVPSGVSRMQGRSRRLTHVIVRSEEGEETEGFGERRKRKKTKTQRRRNQRVLTGSESHRRVENDPQWL